MLPSGRDKFRFALPAVVLAAAALFLTGCVYLRLLTVKNQLKEFDRNVGLSGGEDLRIRFLDPALYDRDIEFLIGAPPLLISGEGPAPLWHYEFDQVRRSTEPAPLARLSLDLQMKDGVLDTLIVPPSFLRLFPRNVLEETMRHAGGARINRKRRVVMADVRLTPPADAALPDRARTLSLLGPPLATEREDGRETLVYRYSIVGDATGAPRIAARMAFDEGGRLRRVFITWDSSSVDAEYIR